ncbi:MAG: hypothetical protein K2P19_06005, partial [Kineothrix sp.]|nr:hypothetical protein [Kineothrix sp.]
MRYKKELAQRPTLGDLQLYGVISYYIKKWLRHFMKNLRFFVNLCPSGDGISCKVKNNLHQQLSREEPFSPTREPGVHQLADTFHLNARVHKKSHLQNK